MYSSKISTQGTPFGLGKTKIEKALAKAAKADAQVAALLTPPGSPSPLPPKSALAIWAPRLLLVGVAVAGAVYWIRKRKKKKGK